jgi:hypothetical protein
MSIVVGDKIFDQIADLVTKKLRPRFSVEIALVSRVFLTRSMHTTIRRAGTGGASATSNENSGSAPASTNPEPGGHGTEAPKPDVALPNTPGVTTSFQFGNSSMISTVVVLQRPVAFGYRSVRWIPGDGS